MKIMSKKTIQSIETKEKILQTTKRMLKTYDFKFLTVRNICEESETTTGSFYYHFKNKEDVIFTFVSEEFKKVLALNPIPLEIEKDDYVHRIIWPMIVYARFCESMGKELTAYLYQTCSDDVFLHCCFDNYVVSVLNYAVDNDIIRLHQNINGMNNVKADIPILLGGVMLYWSNTERNKTGEQLCVVLERVMYRFLSSFQPSGRRVSFSLEQPLFTDEPEKWINRIVLLKDNE